MIQQRTAQNRGTALDLTVPTILWAVDPFAPDEFELQAKLAQIIGTFSERVKLIPVYVLSRDDYNWDGQYSGAWTAEQKPQAKEAVNNMLEKLQRHHSFEGLELHPTVLVHNDESKGGAAARLCRFAKKVRADLIVTCVQGSPTLMKIVSGSFVEDFIVQSQIPLMVINPHTLPSHCCQTLVFATDFSPSCINAFEQILPVARFLHADIHFFYKVPNPVEPIVQSGVSMFGGGWVSLDAYLEDEGNSRELEGQRWVVQAKQAGINARWVSGADHGIIHEKTSQAIVEYASRLPNAMIVMTAQSGPLSSALFGSTTRDVMHTASCPVFVIPYVS